MSKVPQSLLENLDRQIAAHDELLGLFSKEAAMEPSFNPDDLRELEIIQKDKLETLEGLKNLDEDREAIIRQLEKDWDTDPGLNISGIMARASAPDAQELKRQRDKLSSTIQRITELGHETAEISKARLGVFQQINESFQGLSPSTAVYASSGKIKKQHRPMIFSRSV